MKRNPEAVAIAALTKRVRVLEARLTELEDELFPEPAKCEACGGEHSYCGPRCAICLGDHESLKHDSSADED